MRQIILKGLLTLLPLSLSADMFGDIEIWNANLSPSDKKSKYCKMSNSPFSFYRGTNHLFWKKYANDERVKKYGNSKTKVWIQGDLHAYNFGAFDNDKNKIVYALNDFDESTIADYQYDVWRMAISLVLIMDENIAAGTLSLSNSEKKDIVDAFSESYLDTMHSFHGNDDELDLEFTKNNTYGRLDDFLDNVEDKNSRLKMLNDWTILINNSRKFNMANEDLSDVNTSEKNALATSLANYGNTLSGSLSYDSHYFFVKDIAKRLNAGTGSLGVDRYYILIEGETNSENDDRILDIKKQSIPTPNYYLNSTPVINNYAQLYVIADKALSVHTDDHLGYLRYKSQNYSVRERSPFKKSFNTSKELTSYTRFKKLAQQWGEILAAAHARSDEDFNPAYISYSADKQIDEITDKHHSDFRKLVRNVAFEYSADVESNYNNFKLSIESFNCNN